MNSMGLCSSLKATPTKSVGKGLSVSFHLWKDGHDTFDLRVMIRGRKDESPFHELQYKAIHALLRTYGSEYAVNTFTGQIAVRLNNKALFQTIKVELEKLGVNVNVWSNI